MAKILSKILLVAVLLSGLAFMNRNEQVQDINLGAIQNLGNTADDASVQTNSTDRKYVNPATAGATGTVVSGVARIWNGGTVNSSSNLVIYTNVSGNCATTETLLAVSDTLTITTAMNTEAARNYTFSGVNQIAIVSGTSYCIGEHHSDPGTGNISISRSNASANVVKSDGDTYSDGPTATCSCTTSSNGPLNLYIQFDDAAGGGGGVVGVNYFIDDDI